VPRPRGPQPPHCRARYDTFSHVDESPYTPDRQPHQVLPQRTTTSPLMAIVVSGLKQLTFVVIDVQMHVAPGTALLPRLSVPVVILVPICRCPCAIPCLPRPRHLFRDNLAPRAASCRQDQKAPDRQGSCAQGPGCHRRRHSTCECRRRSGCRRRPYGRSRRGCRRPWRGFHQGLAVPR
jgi:hypothetical protein